MKEASYTDSDGRHVAVWLPEGLPDSDASLGIHRGPPPLDGMGLPLELEVKLNNELFQRRMFEWADVKRNREQLVQAIRAVLSMSVERLLVIYHEATIGHEARPKPSLPIGDDQIVQRGIKPSLESSTALADNQKDGRAGALARTQTVRKRAASGGGKE